MLLGVQILGVLFAVALIYLSYMQYKRKEFTSNEVIFWTALWVVFIFVTLFPSSLDFILESLSIARAMDFFTIIGFLFLIGLTFHNYIVVKKSSNKIEKIIRRIAFENDKNTSEAKEDNYKH